MTVRIKSWARVYLRRSTSAQESSLETQLQWTIDAARRYGIPLRASLDDLKHKQLHRLRAVEREGAIDRESEAAL